MKTDYADDADAWLTTRILSRRLSSNHHIIKFSNHPHILLSASSVHLQTSAIIFLLGINNFKSIKIPTFAPKL